MSAIILVVFIVGVLLYATVKRVNVYHSFADGVKQSLKLSVSVFPYLATVCIAVAVFDASSLSKLVYSILEYPFGLLGIPNGLIELVVIRPLSGSGSLVLLENVLKEYGADSQVARAASVIMGSSDTIFFIGALYFAKRKNKKSGAFLPIALASSFFGVILSCLLVKII